MMNEELASKFIKVVKKLFSYLESYGFSIDEGPIEKSELHTTVAYTGVNVAIVFSYDFMEKVCDCYVGRVINGELCIDKNKNGFWSPLFSYLVRTQNYRGGVVLDKDIEYEEFEELYEYDVMIRTVGSDLLRDDVDS